MTLDEQQTRALIRLARIEDLGPRSEDVTSAAMVPADLTGAAQFVARDPGILCGAALLPWIIQEYDNTLELHALLHDGHDLESGLVIGELSGQLRAILTVERVALNFMSHLSGIATLTGRYVDAVAGTGAVICDTRKTLPGWRDLQKYAVQTGGGMNHRQGLYDAMLIKDNHLAHLRLEEIPAAIDHAIDLAGHYEPPLRFVQVEVDSLQQLEKVLHSEPTMVLLDNMTPAELAQAVKLRDRIAASVQLEASGGVNLKTVAAIAATGVDRISVGALTHSAPALDIGLDIESDTA